MAQRLLHRCSIRYDMTFKNLFSFHFFSKLPALNHIRVTNRAKRTQHMQVKFSLQHETS